jgi:hypothetical protein
MEDKSLYDKASLLTAWKVRCYEVVSTYTTKGHLVALVHLSQALSLVLANSQRSTKDTATITRKIVLHFQTFCKSTFW